MRRIHYIGIALAVMWIPFVETLPVQLYASIFSILFIVLIIHIIVSEAKARTLAGIKTILHAAENQADSDCTPPDDPAPPDRSPAAQ